MKIDLHCHTKRTKSGEPETRNVTKELFHKKIIESNVSIVAITNHNNFDYNQFIDFSSNNSDFLLFPGIELDIVGIESVGHCLLITDPSYASNFNKLCNELIGDITPDDFSVNIMDFIEFIKKENFIVIPHYGSKAHALKDNDINLIMENVDSIPVLLEPSNLRSAGILLAHNYSTIIGSDIRNWNNYEQSNLPELKIRIDGFSQFIKLLKKDIPAIQTFIKGKYSERIIIKPEQYPDCNIELDIYNDINVIFGGKGTGKTELLLKEIQKHYDNRGYSDVSAYYQNEALDSFNRFNLYNLEENNLGLITKDDLRSDFSVINNYTSATITPTKEYYKWINSRRAKNRIFGFSDSTFTNSLSLLQHKYDFELKHYNDVVEKISDLYSLATTPYLEELDILQLKLLVSKLFENSWLELMKSFVIWKSNYLLEWSLIQFKQIYLKKTSIFSKPPKTGIISVFEKSLSVYDSATRIIEAFNLGSVKNNYMIGNLIDKGAIYQRVEIAINPTYANRNSKYFKNTINKSNLDLIKRSFSRILENAYKIQLNESISNYKRECINFNIKSLSDLLFYNIQIVNKDNQNYDPSPGEKTMLLLHSKLMDDSKNIFILDEPEAKVGHKYINDIILPRLLELARRDKIIIITTHDANLAVRTLPLTSIYREQLHQNGTQIYRTFIGSPFLDKMVCYEDSALEVEWVLASMNTLEGGENAFIERKENYGKKY